MQATSNIKAMQVTIGTLIIIIVPWLWIVYSFYNNHLIIAFLQYGLYLLGIFMLVKSRGVSIAITLFAGMGIGLVYEIVGTRTGLPFGEYNYTLIVGGFGIPWFIVLMWGLLSVVVYLAVEPLIRKSVLGIPIAALLLVALDFSIDPVMVERGLWSWEEEGIWYGVPFTNFLGWFWVGVNILFLTRVMVIRYEPRYKSPWRRLLVVPYLSHLFSYGVAAPLGALLASLVLGIGVIVVLLREIDL